MLTHRNLVAVLTVLLALTIGAGTANAGRYQIQIPPDLSLVLTGSVSFGGDEMEGADEELISCPMTLSGSVSSSFESSGGTAASLGIPSVGTCSFGTIVGLRPTFVQSEILLGGEHLPREPERVTGWLGYIKNFEFLITRGFTRCLYRGDIGILVDLIWDAATRTLSEGDWDLLFLGSRIELIRNLAILWCPRAGFFWFGGFRPRVPKAWVL